MTEGQGRSISIDPKLHRELKILAAERVDPIRKLAEEAIATWLRDTKTEGSSADE